MGENKLISSLPGYDTHRLTFNLRGYDTFYSQSTYYGGIINMFYGDTYINNVLVATQSWCTQNFLSGLGYLQLSGCTLSGNLNCSVGLSKNGNIYKYSSTAPPNANCIGYTSQVNISQYKLNIKYISMISYLTITLPYAGTYECSASVCLQYSCDYIYICII